MCNILVQKPFDFHLFPSNPMGLVPVHFSESHYPFGQADTRHAFEFPPTTGPKLAPQSHNISNPTADRNRFNLLDSTDYLNIHCGILRCIPHEDQCPSVQCVVTSTGLLPAVDCITASRQTALDGLAIGIA
jgi:hypothetical protein